MLKSGVFCPQRWREGDGISLSELQAFDNAIDHKSNIVSFSSLWYKDRTFPAHTCSWIRDYDAIPFIHLILNSQGQSQQVDPKSDCSAIISGKFDKDLMNFAHQVRDFGSEIWMEWGGECNGSWFPWSAVNNGFELGPQKFREAYRHIIGIFKGAGADNVKWSIHWNDEGFPKLPWNTFNAYYPGDDYIDMMGISCYGKDTTKPFKDRFNRSYAEMTHIALSKPIYLLETGCNGLDPKAPIWLADAVVAIEVNRWKRLAGVSWWNEAWRVWKPSGWYDVNMRLQDCPYLAEIWRGLWE